MARITGGHHIFGIEHLLSELWYCKSSVLLATSGGQGGEARDEEMQSRERHHIYCQFSQICVELTREAKASCDT